MLEITDFYEVERLYYPCSENKGADQLHGYRTTEFFLTGYLSKHERKEKRETFWWNLTENNSNDTIFRLQGQRHTEKAYFATSYDTSDLHLGFRIFCMYSLFVHL